MFCVSGKVARQIKGTAKMAKTVVVGCHKTNDPERFDVYVYYTTWTGFREAQNVTRAECWKIADRVRATMDRSKKLSVSGLGKRRKGE